MKHSPFMGCVPLIHLNSFRTQLKPIHIPILTQRLPARSREHSKDLNICQNKYGNTDVWQAHKLMAFNEAI